MVVVQADSAVAVAVARGDIRAVIVVRWRTQLQVHQTLEVEVVELTQKISLLVLVVPV